MKNWRIPSLKELYSLIEFTGRVKSAEAITLFIDTAYFYQPTGDESIGEHSIDAQTWSSTHYTGLTMRGDTTIFGVNFVDGRIKGYLKYKPQRGAANTMYFRMVRGNSKYGKTVSPITTTERLPIVQQCLCGNKRTMVLHATGNRR